MKRHSTRLLICAFLVPAGLVTGLVSAQSVPAPYAPPIDPELETLPISSRLFHFDKRVATEGLTGNELEAAAKSAGLQVLESRLVNVEIFRRDLEVPVSEDLIRAVGGRIDAVWRGLTAAWIPPDRATELARSLPAGYYLRQTNPAFNNDEGPATVRSDTYRDAGADGTGIIVGIIDRNFHNLTVAENLGFVPVATRHDYVGGGFEDGTNVHGTAHLETVFDHVPGATYHLFRINSAAHLGQAVNAAISLGVNVLSATQSFYNEGWDDDSGPANAAVTTASDAGILYFSSAGNRGETHWQGLFDDSTENGWLDWAPGDVYNDLTEVPIGERVILFLQWDRYGGGPDLNLFLYDASYNLLDSSTSGSDNFESIDWTNNTGAPAFPKMAVRMSYGTPVELEVFNIGRGRFQYQTPAGSITSPNTNTAINCLAVGMVPFNTYSDGNLDPASSRGPTNSGNSGIDLVGPTGTTTWAYQGAFGGTSCATPNCAGAAAALWSSVPGFNTDGIRLLVLHQSSLYNDWGSEGIDPGYGFGGIFFYPFAGNHVWVDRTSFNFGGLPSLPWYYVQDAVDNSIDNDCLLFMGGVFYEPVVISEPRLLKSAGESAHIGGF